jgi:hypothetical protein
MREMEKQGGLFGDDNLNLMLRNDVIVALRSRNGAAGREKLKVLADAFPNDSLLPSMEILFHTPDAPAERFPDHSRVADAILNMDKVVIPAANLVFGAQEAREWLAPMWRALANAAAQLPYNTKSPHTHAASIYMRGSDWAAAQAQVATIPSWRRIPAPLAWMAEATFFGQGGLDAAWCLLVELAWIDPSRFGKLVRRLNSEDLLRKVLKDFDVDFASEDPSYLAWFPAFMLIEDPALAAVLRETQVCGNSAPERTARLVVDLLALEREGRHEEIVAKRKRLRDQHAGLFSRYMRTR